MDFPICYGNVCSPQGRRPGENMLVDCVDQGSIEIEQDGWSHGFKAHCHCARGAIGNTIRKNVFMRQLPFLDRVVRVMYTPVAPLSSLDDSNRCRFAAKLISGWIKPTSEDDSYYALGR